MDKNFDCLKLENQLCFPLYVCSKEIVRRYKPYLDELDLTYTQYITMMALWECKEINVKELGEKLYLDSGTLTPLLKKLEKRGYVERTRDSVDERKLVVTLTERGRELESEVADVPSQMACNVTLTPEEGAQFAALLHKMIDGFEVQKG